MSDKKIQTAGLILAIIFGLQQYFPENPSFEVSNPKLSLYTFSEAGLIIAGAAFLSFALIRGIRESRILSNPYSEILEEISFSTGIFLSIVTGFVVLTTHIILYTVVKLESVPNIVQIGIAALIISFATIGAIVGKVVDWKDEN